MRDAGYIYTEISIMIAGKLQQVNAGELWLHANGLNDTCRCRIHVLLSLYKAYSTFLYTVNLVQCSSLIFRKTCSTYDYGCVHQAETILVFFCFFLNLIIDLIFSIFADSQTLSLIRIHSWIYSMNGQPNQTSVDL